MAIPSLQLFPPVLRIFARPCLRREEIIPFTLTQKQNKTESNGSYIQLHTTNTMHITLRITPDPTRKAVSMASLHHISTSTYRRSVELIETPILRVECLDHHFSLVAVGYHQSSCVKDHVHCVDYSVEAAGCSSLLREPNDAEWLFLTMLNHCNDLCSKGYFFQIQN